MVNVACWVATSPPQVPGGAGRGTDAHAGAARQDGQGRVVPLLRAAAGRGLSLGAKNCCHNKRTTHRSSSTQEVGEDSER